MRFLCVESHSPAEVEKVVDFIGQQQVYLNEERVRYGGHASSLPLNVWGETMQQGSSTAVSCCHVSTLYLTISDFFTPPWGRCWNRVHLSSLHTQLELTCAFIFARGWWVSPTQTFRPLRRLLSSSVSLPISLPLFACAHSNHARFLFLCFSFPPFFFHFLSFLSSLFLFSTLRPLSGTRQIVLSEEANRSGGQQILCVSRRASMCVLACVCVCVAQYWIWDRRVICFPVTACDPKTTSEVWSIAGQVPAAGGEARDEILTSFHHQTI